MSGSSSGRMGRMTRGVPSGAVHGSTYRRGYGRMARRGSSCSVSAGSCSTTRASSASKPVRRREQGIDVELRDGALLHHEHAEPDEQLLERVHVHRRAPADAPQRGRDAGLLDHPAGEGGVERRQAERPVPEHLHQLTTHPEQQQRPELRIHRRADDELVALGRDHGLDGHAVERSETGATLEAGPDRPATHPGPHPRRAGRAGHPRRRSCGSRSGCGA